MATRYVRSLVVRVGVLVLAIAALVLFGPQIDRDHIALEEPMLPFRAGEPVQGHLDVLLGQSDFDAVHKTQVPATLADPNGRLDATTQHRLRG